MHLNPRLTHAFTEYLPPSDRPLCFFLLQSKKELFCKPMKNTKFFLGGHIITKVIFCIQICCAKVCVLENCVRSCSLPCKFELHKALSRYGLQIIALPLCPQKFYNGLTGYEYCNLWNWKMKLFVVQTLQQWKYAAFVCTRRVLL